jgi:hypothetical protein
MEDHAAVLESFDVYFRIEVLRILNRCSTMLNYQMGHGYTADCIMKSVLCYAVGGRDGHTGLTVDMIASSCDKPEH